MKKIIKYVVSFSFIFLLFPVSVIAGEIIEAECTLGESEILLLLLDSDGGKQNLMGTEMNVLFTKDKVVMSKDNVEDKVIIDFKSGNLFMNGLSSAAVVCKFSNLEALEKENTVDTEEEVQEKENTVDAASDTDADEGKIIQLLESMKTQLDEMKTQLNRIEVNQNSD